MSSIYKMYIGQQQLDEDSLCHYNFISFYFNDNSTNSKTSAKSTKDLILSRKQKKRQQ